MAMRLIKIHKPPIFLAKPGGASQVKQHDNDNVDASPYVSTLVWVVVKPSYVWHFEHGEILSATKKHEF